MNLDFRTKKEIEQHQQVEKIQQSFREIKENQRKQAEDLAQQFRLEHERNEKELAELRAKVAERIGIDQLEVQRLRQELLAPEKKLVNDDLNMTPVAKKETEKPAEILDEV